MSPFFSLLHPAISQAPAAGAPAAPGKVSSCKWVPCHVQSSSALETLLAACSAAPPNLAEGASGSPWVCRCSFPWVSARPSGTLLTYDQGDGHGDPLLGQVSGAQGGSRLALPAGTCWTWTPSPSPTQVGGGAGWGHGMVDMARHDTAAWLCSSLRSGGPLCAGLGQQRVEGGERGPLSWLIPGWVKWAHMATRVHANDPSPSTLMIRPRQQR